MSKVQRNFELLKAMETVVRSMNNDEAIEPWLMCGVPDGADDDEIMEMAADDDSMEWACASFGRIMRRFSKDGWFTDYGGEQRPVAYGVVE